MTPRPTNRELQELVNSLARLSMQPDFPAGDALLANALSSGSPHAQAKAAELICEHRRSEHGPALLKAYTRAFKNPIKSDPGCRLKSAAAEALDFLDHADPETFLKGITHVQREGGYGTPEDTAGPLRARCGMALVRMRYDRVLEHLADLLCDARSEVRVAGARAIAFHGDERGIGLLRMRLHFKETDPDVIHETLKAYLNLDTAQGLIAAERMMDGNTNELEGALLALGESPELRAFELLNQLLERTAIENDMHLASLALGTQRRPEARQVLLERVAEGSQLQASCALRGLALQSWDPEVRASAIAAERCNEETSLERLIEQIFPLA
jgi:hypothetical protein